MKKKRLAGLMLALFVLATSACSFDRRRTLAYDLLFAADGSEREDVFHAALRERFAPGTAVAELEAFAVEAQGECREPEAGIIDCEIPIRGGLCWARLLKIEATSRDGMLLSTRFLLGGLGC